jgi:hypothetical protein
MVVDHAARALLVGADECFPALLAGCAESNDRVSEAPGLLKGEACGETMPSEGMDDPHALHHARQARCS